MARQLCLLTALTLLGGTFAMADPVIAAAPGKPEGENKQGSAKSPEFENVHKALEALTPEQRERFQKNLWRWSNLTPEQKKALRDREELRRKRREEDVQRAIQQSGLTLEGEQRARFEKRYSEERRKIEEQLRREMEEKRKPLIDELVGKLKQEFSSPAAP
jgi:Spy/CpxP family protein refolding chaperone